MKIFLDGCLHGILSGAHQRAYLVRTIPKHANTTMVERKRVFGSLWYGSAACRPR
jgi:hypothetical protein